VGRAIVRRPRCTLLDEPLSNLDAGLRLRLRAELKALHQRLRMTSIYVTHDQEEALTLGEHLVVMAGGRVQQAGAPLDVFRAPANRFVAGFIGAPPMNFIDGRLRAEGGMVSFTDGKEIDVALGAGAADRWRGLAQWSGRPVVLGVRPEHLRFGDAAAGASEVPIAVTVVEPLGTRMDVVGTTAAGTSVTARLDGSLDLAPGDRPVLRVRPDDLHLFEPEPDGRRIDPRP
jgi:ABC-type sugar transport system ATPase subunit